jgi:D-glycero-D-manno-heptose 1,7-bisphosphate phosphatase
MSVGNKALFLDRDGVINVDRDYVHLRTEFEFKPGIFELCLAAQELGYLLIVVTNQAGIARGYYSEAKFQELSRWMVDEFKNHQVDISAIYYCPYHPVFGVGKYKADSPDRKPNPGMLLRAQAELNLDLGSSILIGDKLTDIQAAVAAGVPTQVLLSSENTESDFPDDLCHVCYSLDEIRHKFFSTHNDSTRKAETTVSARLP